MTTKNPPTLRIWPAVALLVLMFLMRFVPILVEGGMANYWMISVFGPLFCCLLLVIWWLAASRASWRERLFGFLGLVGLLAATTSVVHPTMRGSATTYLTAPMGLFGFVLGAALFKHYRPGKRTGAALLLAFIGFSFSILLRNEGMTGDYVHSLHWRWNPSAEESMVLSRVSAAAAIPIGSSPDTTQSVLANPEWPGFRGADRSGRWRGRRVASDWHAHPPRQLWKIPVGPGWSSFALAGRMLFTQEQRGPLECVVCYDAETGKEIWIRRIETRFDDPLGGPGPRATPTLAQGKLFAAGATGLCLRLDPATGEVVWQQDLKSLARPRPPMWGFSASPLVAGSTVVFYAGGAGDKGLIAFDADSGAARWTAAAGQESYSSPQLANFAGEDVVLLLSNDGLLFLDPTTGKERLNYSWKFMGYRALQPHLVGDDTVLLPSGIATGTRAIRISSTNGQFTAQELWTSRELKPDFTDFVTHEGHAYGIDGGIFSCVDLKTGQRKWKGGRYGKGQVVLLEASGLLLVAAEPGHVVLLRADPNAHTELYSFKALEGKTWNHPVVVGDRLYLRNAQEAAAFVLPLAEEK